MKAIWEGSISLALLNIPVKLYPAVYPRTVSFKTLHDSDSGELRYKRFCSKCHKEVPWEHVVKGFPLGERKYYVLTKEKLAKLRPETSDYIDILGFIDAKMMDVMYLDRPYYVAPAQEKEKAYFLFKEVLQSTAKAALGKFVMREKEYICIIESYKKGLVLITLNYPYEIKDINEIEELKKPATATKQEQQMAQQLVDKFTLKKLDLTIYKDSFAQKLKELILADMKGKPIKIEKKKPTKSLMKALKASIK